MPIDITNQTRRAQYAISGTGPYDVDFEILEQTDIAVYRDATLLTLMTHYTVVINSDGTAAVTLVSATGTTITIVGARPYQRLTDYATGGDFQALTLNLELDSLQIQILQIVEAQARALALAITADPDVSATLPEPEASTLIGWSSDGLSLVNYLLADIADVLVSSYGADLIAAANAAAARVVLDAMQNVFTTRGDMVRAGVAGVAERVAIGAVAQAWTAGATDPAWADVPLPRSYIAGLTFANNAGDATNDIDVTVGAARDSTNTANIVLAAALIKRLDAAWVVGTNQGGILSGSAADVDYNIWLIKRPDTGVVDVGLETTASATPTLPANYTVYRKIGWFKRVSGAIVAFHTYETEGGGLDFAWDVPTLDVNLANTLTTARRTDAAKVPLNFSTIANLNVAVFDVAGAATAWVCCPDVADAAPSNNTAPLYNAGAVAGANGGTNTGSQMSVRTSAAGLIAARGSIATIDLYAVTTLGFSWARRN